MNEFEQECESRVEEIIGKNALKSLNFNSIAELVNAFSYGNYDRAALADYCEDFLDWHKPASEEESYLEAMDHKRDQLAGK